MPQVEPCANLPKTHLMVTAWYCHLHQAWLVTSSAHTQTSESTIVDVVPYTAAEFGPFDDRSDVFRVAVEALAQGLYRVGPEATQAAHGSV